MSTSAEQIVRNLPPAYLEEYYKDMARTLSAQMDRDYNLPAFEVAGLTPAQQQAVSMGLGGVGSFMPMLEAGEGTLARGIGGYDQAMEYALAGAPLFGQAAESTQAALGQATPYQQMASNALQNAILGGQEQALAGQQAASSAAGALGA